MARFDPATNNTYYSLGDRLFALAFLPMLCGFAWLVSLLGHHSWTAVIGFVIGIDIFHAAWIIVIGQENHDPD
jgi:hypothetical protein